MPCTSCAERRQLVSQAGTHLRKGEVRPAAIKLQEAAISAARSFKGVTMTAWRKPAR